VHRIAGCYHRNTDWLLYLPSPSLVVNNYRQQVAAVIVAKTRIAAAAQVVPAHSPVAATNVHLASKCVISIGSTDFAGLTSEPN